MAPDKEQCSFPNCAGMALLKESTDNIDEHIKDMKSDLQHLPTILEHVAASATEISALRNELNRAVREHDEIFSRLRVLEGMSSAFAKASELEEIKRITLGRSWVDSMKSSCVQVSVMLAGAMLLSVLGFSFYMIVVHWQEITLIMK